MRESTAKALTERLLRHLAEKDAILGTIKADEPAEAFARIKLMIGQTMGAICGDALDPLLAEYPALAPPQMRRNGR